MIPISIHALLAESDIRGLEACAPNGNFYPRSPCGERQQTLPFATGSGHFYPRSPCGERQIAFLCYVGGCNISIHALLAESDPWNPGQTARCARFLSTLSLRRATSIIILDEYQKEISIHALLAESDRIDPDQVPGYTISIHALLAESDGTETIFCMCYMISIHALLAESDHR